MPGTRSVPVIVAILAAALALGVLTGVGSQRRHPGLVRAGLSAAFFPVAWAVWYVRDEHPYARSH
jgi:hypothetical protein